MKFCPKCGQQVPDRGRFCRACGAPLSQRPKKPQPAAAASAGASTAATAPTAPTRVAAPASAIGARDELEDPPAPPARGIALTWHRAANGAIRRADEASGGRAVVSVAGPAGAGGVAIAPAEQLLGLPPPPTQWRFRTQTSAWADAASASLRGSNTGIGSQSFVEIATRLIRGALMHREIYRHVAQRTDLETEGYAVAGAIIVAGYLGTVLFSFAGLFGAFSLKVLFYFAIVQALAWAAAVMAIHVAVKTLHQLELSPMLLFRTLIYAQAATLLSFVPLIGGLTALWAGVCTAAALHDVTGKRTADAIVLTLIGGVAAAIGTYVARVIVG